MDPTPPPEPHRLSANRPSSSTFVAHGSSDDDVSYGTSDVERTFNKEVAPTDPSDDANVQSINVGKSREGGIDNAVYSSKYTLISFLPKAIREQFRRFSNVYFLVIGFLVVLGTYTDLFAVIQTPLSALAPLALIITVSLVQEGITDLGRHRRDKESNDYPCTVLRSTDDIDEDAVRITNINDGNAFDVRLVTNLSRSNNSTNSSGRVKVAFVTTKRMDIRAGEIVLIRNREMVPADIILLASSGERGGAYVETSQIDGETNLKLRTSPTIPLGSVLVSISSNLGSLNYKHPGHEDIGAAVKRVTRLSLLGYPEGVSALHNPKKGPALNTAQAPQEHFVPPPPSRLGLVKAISMAVLGREKPHEPEILNDTNFVATLTSELPNASVNTFQGTIALPPVKLGTAGVNIPLDAENFLLRGSALRNTEWALGVACFTGTDTKLIQNSTKTPSKFSRLDESVNKLVLLILLFMFAVVIVLALLHGGAHKDLRGSLWYVGFNENKDEAWPYLPNTIDSPNWGSPQNTLQIMFTYITLLSNFVPISLYISVELTTLCLMLLIGFDKNMYHKETDTYAAARSSIVSDLGQVEYIFSDKTGTLTQNIMEFKRCSVGGKIFGEPIKSAPPDTEDTIEPTTGDDSVANKEFYPLGNLLRGPGQLYFEGANDSSTEHGLKKAEVFNGESAQNPKLLTFNAEMFLRVMSICHTVVVEKDTDPSGIGMDVQNDSTRGSPSGIKQSENSLINNANTKDPPCTDPKSAKGAPSGYSYQAESPDEEALVSAASLEFGFQLKSRDSSGLTITCQHSSLLSNDNIARGLKNGTLTAKKLASDTDKSQKTNGDASYLKSLTDNSESQLEDNAFNKPGEETWTILAVNKFDSTRKRMSVVVRSPPEFGSVHMLLCKGADSAMLNPDVACGAVNFEENDASQLQQTSDNDDGSEFERTNMLQIHVKLGTFATEGLRTLVLGIRILKEKECTEWVKKYEAAAASLVDRDSALTSLAADIEKNIHIVGSTAIEDKLQDGVPEAISNIRKAGIKLWVLTGDKRETATEIGYSSKVLDPSMNVTDIADGEPLQVRALIATEFVRLVKMGKLSRYQKAELQDQTKSARGRICHQISFVFRYSLRAWRRFYHKYIRGCCGSTNKSRYEKVLKEISQEETAEKDPLYMRKNVRSLAEKVIAEYKESTTTFADTTHLSNMDPVNNNGVREVFNRAKSALFRSTMIKSTMTGGTLLSNLGNLDEEESDDDTNEDVLELESIAPGEVATNFDGKRRSFLERLFASDHDVRNGMLNKHLTREKKDEIFLETSNAREVEVLCPTNRDVTSNVRDIGHIEDQVRALIIEGSALSHFLGDPCYEEMLFAVASCCKSIIACRVSPKQKALIVNLVQNSVSPSPVSLAIGDGANDVGMIQVAHVGIGISGLEGQQAVNSSDFSIAQFRYLEELLLVHGRWDFIRLGKVIHFSFYKNALQQALAIFYSSKTLYSGDPLIDIWVNAMFNVVTLIPILVVGIFDRDLERAYTRKHPSVYASGPRNESFSLRVSIRWAVLFLLQGIIIYFFTADIVGGVGASMSSAFKGLMRNKIFHGDGEGGGVFIFGTTSFIALILVLSVKVLFESNSIIYGVWPAFTCRKNVGDGFWNRVAYTWHGILFGSIILTFAFLYIYQLFHGIVKFAQYTSVTWHLLHTRSLTWIVIILVSTSAVLLDVVLKLFSNMFYPAQIQIHREIQWRERQTK